MKTAEFSNLGAILSAMEDKERSKVRPMEVMVNRGKMMSHTIKRAEAIKFLNERGIWRGAPGCQHQYRPHDPAALRDNRRRHRRSRIHAEGETGMSKQAIDEAFRAIEDALRIADRRTEIFDSAWNAIAALKEAIKQYDAEPVFAGDERRHVICVCPDCIAASRFTEEK